MQHRQQTGSGKGKPDLCRENTGPALTTHRDWLLVRKFSFQTSDVSLSQRGHLIRALFPHPPACQAQDVAFFRPHHLPGSSPAGKRPQPGVTGPEGGEREALSSGDTGSTATPFPAPGPGAGQRWGNRLSLCGGPSEEYTSQERPDGRPGKGGSARRLPASQTSHSLTGETAFSGMRHCAACIPASFLVL